MDITIAVQVHNFQRRFSWMLSSLMHQIDAPEIKLDVSHVKDNGEPTTEAICDLYDNFGFRIHRYEYPYEILQYRGLTRNGAILRCNTEWLLFADCDMVYHPEFFARLRDYIDSVDESKYNSIFISGRRSQPNHTIANSNTVVDAEDFSNHIAHPWKRADARLPKKMRSCVGAGYFQLINIDKCEHGSYYVDPEANRDRSWIDKFAKASSDGQFRRRIGNCHKLPRWFWRAQIHLNHYRDNQFGKHLEDQR